MTQEDRIKAVANMLFANRARTTQGHSATFNNEAMLVFLVAPDWFLEVAGSQDLPSMLPQQRDLETLWASVQNDIQKMFPGSFDWENQRRASV